MANKLLEVETLGGEEMREILNKVRMYQADGATNGHIDQASSQQPAVVVGPGAAMGTDL